VPVADRAAEQRRQADEAGQRLGDRYMLAFAAPEIGADGVSEPFEALRVGNHIYAGREIVITEADLDKAVENFERYWKPAGGVPVDYDHSFVESGDSTAAGWIVSMERRGGSLYEQVQWTPKAQQQIKDGEYRFYSAEFTGEWVNEQGHGEGFTVLAGALTNRPFLRGMTPVALSQAVVEQAGKWTLDHADKLVPGEASSRDETRRGVADKTNTDEQPTTFTVEIDGEAREFTAAEVVALHTAKADADKAKADAEAAKATATAEAGKTEALSQRVDQLATELDTERFNTAFSQAQREGRVDAKPETRTKWEGRLEKFGLEATKELLEDQPADVVPVSERGKAGGGSRPGETPVEHAAPEDTDPAMYSLDQRAQQLLREKPELKGNYREALSQARQEQEASA
jgi:phage I-like protein